MDADSGIVNQGTLGDGGITWTLDKEGTLTISGNGSIPDYGFTEYGSTSPFYKYRSIIKKVIIDHGITSIGKYTFTYCSGLTTVELPSGVTSIGKNAFFNCSGLTTVELPSGVTNIGDFAFFECTNLVSINIPDTVTSIGDGAFSSCKNLKSVHIPSGVTSIGRTTFCDCTSLASIGIPKSVKSIEDYAFGGCSALSNVYYEGSEADWTSLQEAIGTNNDSLKNAQNIHYGSVFVTLNKTALNLKSGDSENLTVTVKPDDAKDKAVTWTSSDTNVATVDVDGKVTATGLGTATITVTPVKGDIQNGIPAKCELTVTQAASSGGGSSSGGSSFASTESTVTETSASDNTVVNATTPTESEIAERNVVSTTVVESTVNPDGTVNDGGIKHNAEYVAKDVESVKAAVEKQAAKKSKSSKKKATSVTIDMTDGASTPANLVPKEVLEAVKGENVNVIFDMGTYSWTVNGRELANTAIRDINIGLLETPAQIPESTVNSIAKKNACTTISLNHSGELGFKARLTINLGKQYKGKYANFYTVNDAGQALSGYAKVDRKGFVTVDFNHGGDYVITFTKKHAKP